uniref:Cyclotide n=1 Tax=Viola tricolor TaxID=214053 RepID=A0A1B2K317_9ROSI|nr:cyclotide [Viola tricolor]
MDSKIVFVALDLSATSALPSRAKFEKIFTTTEAARPNLKKTNSNAIPSKDAINALTGKTLLSSIALEEALLNNPDNRRNGIPCGESCVWIPCITGTIGCSCKSKVCYTNSPEM